MIASSHYENKVFMREFFMLYVPPANEPWVPHFHSYLKQIWQLMNEDLIELKATNGHPNAIESTRVALYVAAVGLATYGHLEKIPFILRNIPTGAGKMARMASVVLQLLPLPEHIRSARDWNLVAEWVEEHANVLAWDKNAECFKLEEQTFVFPSPTRASLVPLVPAFG